jgi:hypothetical protein
MLQPSPEKRDYRKLAFAAEPTFGKRTSRELATLTGSVQEWNTTRNYPRRLVSNVDVKLIGRLLYSLGVIAGVLLCVALFLQAEMRVLRYRAERLLSDFQSVELQQSTFQQTAQLREKWSRWISYANGRLCTTATCDFSVVLEDFSVRHSTTFERPWLVRAYVVLGGRPARIAARAYLENGIVSTEDIGIETLAPASSGRTYDISVSVHGSAHYADAIALGPKHYRVHRAANCWNCIFVDFAPDIEQSDHKRLLLFDFSCLTAFTICRNADDLMPKVLVPKS